MCGGVCTCICMSAPKYTYMYTYIFIYKVVGYVRRSSRLFLLQTQTKEIQKNKIEKCTATEIENAQLSTAHCLFSSRSLVWGCCIRLRWAKGAVVCICIGTMTTWLSQVTCRLICSVFSTPQQMGRVGKTKCWEKKVVCVVLFFKPTSPRPWD